MAITSVEITKNPNENSASVLRRFSRKIQESGIIQKVKSKRYAQRATSKLAQKTSALKRIVKKKAQERLRKLGKIK